MIYSFLSDMTLSALMLVTSYLFISYHFIAEAIPVAVIPEADLVVNLEKGFVLEWIGSYSNKANEAIIHTFLPVTDVCKSFAGTKICLRAPDSIDNSIELGTILSTNDRHSSLSHYEKNNISHLITQEINSLLLNQKPGQFLLNVPSNFHYFNGDFYIHNSGDQLNDGTVQIANKHKEFLINDQKNSPYIILDQLKNQRIGFSFLTDAEIRLILSPIMQSIEKSYETANVQKLVAHFSPLIVSQTVNAFRTCSINQNDPTAPSCLIVSTLFTMPSSSPVDKYITYHLVPIPIITQEYQYQYNSLPKMFAFNEIDQSVILFDDYLLTQCTLSTIVQCSIEPTPIALSAASCLNQMLSTQPISSHDCEVTRSVRTKSPILHVIHDIWIFNDKLAVEQCTIKPYRANSNRQSNNDNILIQHVTCGQSIKCTNNKPIRSTCLNETIMITDNQTPAEYKLAKHFQLTLQPLKQTLLTQYKNNMIDLLTDMKQYENENTSNITRLYKKFIILLIGIISLSISALISIFLKIIRRNIQHQLDIVERRVNNLSDIFLSTDD